MATIVVTVTKSDIQGAGITNHDNPITRALERATGSRWYVAYGVACEAMAPFRTVVVRGTAYDALRDFRISGEMSPFEFNAPLMPVEEVHPWEVVAANGFAREPSRAL